VELQEGEGWAISDVCALLYGKFPESPFVATLSVKEDGSESWSFRSDADGGNVDVAAIAAQFGGGGHRNAAGCVIGQPAEEGSDA